LRLRLHSGLRQNGSVLRAAFTCRDEEWLLPDLCVGPWALAVRVRRLGLEVGDL